MDKDFKQIFSWPDKSPWGLQVSNTHDSQVSSEVMYEEDATKIRERPIYVGLSIPLHRFYYLAAALFLMIGALMARAFWMQGISYSYYQAKADSNRLRTMVIIPPRGMIVDRQGVVLAENESTFDVTVVPLDLPLEESKRNEILGTIARVTGTDIAALKSVVDSSTVWDRSVPLVRDIPYEQAITLKIKLAGEQSVDIVHGLKRKYRQSGQLLSLGHILGYVGKISPEQYEEKKQFDYQQTDLVGKAGIEESYEFWLAGQRGERITEVDAFGQGKRIVHDDEAVSGQILELSIDLRLQKAAEDAIKKSIEENEDIKKGVAIAMDPRDGSILASVSWPAYDNNAFSGKVSSTVYAALLDDPNTPLLPRAWAGLYPSGSTIKPVYALAALADGIITPRTTILSTGGIWVSSRFFPDWKPGGHGLTDVRRAIAWSVNTFFYTIGGGTDNFTGLGANRMAEWLYKFGFGEPLGLDVAGEYAGLVPTPEWRVQKRNERWYIGDTYNYAIGQGDFLVTPLQIAVSTAEIANGGKRIRPHFVMNQNAYASYEESEPMNISDEPLAGADDVEVVRLGMRDTVLYGSGRSFLNFPVPVAGKTGTAQWRADKPNHAWFTAFAPFEEPRIVVTVLLEEGTEGSETAIPVARAILEAWNTYSDELP
ncbi:MAG: penicillin-binding protein 2 [Patescibacteria group bacterium]|nr:penicillin-binding protein 2 [Patescibacteria group bacterium]